MAISYGGDSIQFADGTNIASGRTGFINRLINGDMRIDQRNAGASVTPNNSYTLDRWQIENSQTGKLTVQQNAGSVTPPNGFTNYLGVTSSSAYSVTSGDYFVLDQYIEGFNVADLGWGTSSASPVTLSFWVRSSLTGTFGGSVWNSANNRSYPFSYTISAANTWEQKSVTIAGDTSGTWLKTNGRGLGLAFGLGVGSTLSGTAGSWAGTLYLSATGATSVVGTSGATFYITGVDLRAGTYTTAPTWEFRSIGQELALCQRYYEKSFPIGTSPANAVYSSSFGGGTCIGFSSVLRSSASFFKVTKRTTPTITIFSSGNPNNVNGQWQIYNASASAWVSGSTAAQSTTENYVSFDINIGSGLTTNSSYITAGDYTASAEL